MGRPPQRVGSSSFSLLSWSSNIKKVVVAELARVPVNYFHYKKMEDIQRF